LENECGRAGVKLIFDAAHAFGSTYRGRPIGGSGDAEIFSLTPTKTLVCGEGGLITTDDSTLAQRLRAGRNYGDTGSYDPELLGLNARFPEFNAAMGLAGISLVDDKIRRHNEIAAAYRARLSGLPGIQFQQVEAGNTSTFKDFSILIDPVESGTSRDEVASALSADGIETRKYYSPAMHQQKLYRQYMEKRDNTLPVSTRIAGSVISLPIYPSLSEEAIDRVARVMERLATGPAQK
jgi:dTDP-4-amino-4,6-dideoxygalactose transaminase